MSTNGMPRYECHKKVCALKIAAIDPHPAGFSLSFEEPSYPVPIVVGQIWFDRHNPQVGGYYVVYEDGYTSWSPAAAFESGYTRIDA